MEDCTICLQLSKLVKQVASCYVNKVGLQALTRNYHCLTTLYLHIQIRTLDDYRRI